MFTLTVSAEDWTAAGAAPASGSLEVSLLHPDLDTPLRTTRSWTLTLDGQGAGAWPLPTIGAGNAFKVRSRVNGLWPGRTFYFADPGAGAHSLTELLQSWQVDRTTLEPSEEALAGWTAAVAGASASASAASASAGYAQDAQIAAEDAFGRASGAASEAADSAAGVAQLQADLGGLVFAADSDDGDSVLLLESGGVTAPSADVVEIDLAIGGTLQVPRLDIDVIPALRLGGHFLWVDNTGKLRISGTAPTSDTGGTIVGSQS